VEEGTSLEQVRKREEVIFKTCVGKLFIYQNGSVIVISTCYRCILGCIYNSVVPIASFHLKENAVPQFDAPYPRTLFA
jgi:hypothetical protein